MGLRGTAPLSVAGKAAYRVAGESGLARTPAWGLAAAYPPWRLARSAADAARRHLAAAGPRARSIRVPTPLGGAADAAAGQRAGPWLVLCHRAVGTRRCARHCTDDRAAAVPSGPQSATRYDRVYGRAERPCDAPLLDRVGTTTGAASARADCRRARSVHN